ncbi:MAG TPA: UDP-N-acetyl-D-mannosamine dehydrogenase, partial [Rhodospirillales bacterium]|nr:UDP-N-acetyl-D-mannosamine dehydrogenase [Rhodospirillales bacterium]
MPSDFQKLCVIGLGYVGLPTAAVFASRGVSVLGVDTNKITVDLINQGKVHIVEPDLDILVNGAVSTGKLKAAATPQPADAFIIAVPTPFGDNHEPNLDYVHAAARSIAPVLAPGSLVIIESTCPVGTTERVSRWLAEARPDLTLPHQAGPHQTGEDAQINIAHSPERVLPGRVLLELVRNDRVVGGITPKCAERTAALYRIAVEGQCHLTTAATAELVKLSENAYRDVNIAFANELSLIADKMGIDVWDAIALANRHPRVNILQPGPGVGGHCIAVDPWFLAHSTPNESPLIQAARGVNDGKPGHVVKKILAAAASADADTIACLGLAYKADIDDMRESPAVTIAAAVARDFRGQVLIVEPHTDDLPDPFKTHKNASLYPLAAALEKAQ